MTKKAVICIGPSASGKSTFAAELKKIGYIEVNRDSVREQILLEKKTDRKYTLFDNMWGFWSFKWEDEVDKIVNDTINQASSQGKSIVISDTNLKTSRRDALKSKLENMGYSVSFEVFGKDLPVDVLWKRDATRKNTVGHDVISKQYETFREEFPRYELKDVSDKPKAVIFDVDGTLAHMKGRRGPFEWDKVDLDEPDDVVLASLVAQHLMGNTIIVMSGRDGVCYDKTWKWLRENISRVSKNFGHQEVPFYLFMRKPDDMRSDVIVKNELFFENVDGKFNIVAAFDDRPKVCRGWYDLGIKVIHCGNPYIEF